MKDIPRPDNLPLPDGTYRLTRDMPAIVPDKRRKADWKARPMKTGMVFCVNWDADFGVQRIWVSGGFESHGVRTDKVPDLCSALERMNEAPTDWIKRVGASPGRILDVLVRDGSITLGDIQRAFARAYVSPGGKEGT